MNARYMARLRTAGRLATTLATLTFTACVIGGNVKTFQPAGAAGIVMHFMFAGSSVAHAAEVLAVRDSGLVVVHADSLKLLRYADTRELDFRPVKRRVTGGRPLGPVLREEVRILTRYPQGISPDLERRLLAAYGQTQIVLAVP